MSVREAQTASFDGTRLHYTVTGDAVPGRPDLLLSDGIGCDGFIWRYLEPRLQSRGRVIHMHMRGHGRSAAPADSSEIEIHSHADDWRAVMDAEGVDSAVMLGHSMGVQVCLETWHRHADRVAGLVLICGSFQNPVATFHDGDSLAKALPILQGVARVGGRLTRFVWNRLVKLPVGFQVARLSEIHPDLARRADFLPYLEHLAQMDPQWFFKMLGGASRHSADGYLEQIDVPTLVITGELDRFTPAHLSATMARRISGSSSLEVAEGTHTTPIEQPTLVNHAVEEFLDAAFAVQSS